MKIKSDPPIRIGASDKHLITPICATCGEHSKEKE